MAKKDKSLWALHWELIIIVAILLSVFIAFSLFCYFLNPVLGFINTVGMYLLIPSLYPLAASTPIAAAVCGGLLYTAFAFIGCVTLALSRRLGNTMEASFSPETVQKTPGWPETVSTHYDSEPVAASSYSTDSSPIVSRAASIEISTKEEVTAPCPQ